MRNGASVAAVVLVGACGGGGTHDVVVRTVSEYGGAPIAGVAVQVDDGAWVTTDADGSARFHAAASPHAVRLHQTTTGTTPSGKPFDLHDVWDLVDQPGDSLVIPVDGSAAPTRHRVTLSGAVSGASGTASAQVLVSARSDAYAGAAQTVMAADGSFTLPDVSWEGDSAHAITVEAIEHDAGDPPVHYRSYGKVSITATDPAGAAGVAVPLAPVSEDHVRGTVAVPAELAGDLHPFLSLAFGDGSSIQVNAGAPLASGAFDFVFPAIPGASPRVMFQAIATGGNSTAERTLALPASDVAFALPSAVTVTAPADGATVGPATVFQWNSLAGGTKYGLTLACDWTTPDGGVHDVNFRIIEAAEPQATVPAIPDLAIPSGTSCTWSVAWFEGNAAGLETTQRADVQRYSYSAEHPIVMQ